MSERSEPRGFMLAEHVVVFSGVRCPDVEVMRDATWPSGELRAWYQAEAGLGRDGAVQRRARMPYLERVASERVRPAYQHGSPPAELVPWAVASARAFM